MPWVAKNGFNTVFAGELDHIAAQVSAYLENLAPALQGRTKYGVHPFIVVAPTDDEAMEIGESAYHAHRENLSYLRSWSGRGGQMTRTQNLKAPATLAEAVKRRLGGGRLAGFGTRAAQRDPRHDRLQLPAVHADQREHAAGVRAARA